MQSELLANEQLPSAGADPRAAAAPEDPLSGEYHDAPGTITRSFCPGASTAAAVTRPPSANDRDSARTGAGQSMRCSIAAPTRSPLRLVRCTNITNCKLIRLFVDDEPFDVRSGELRSHERLLDFRAGVLTRRAEWVSPAGRAVRVSSVRLVSFTQRAVAAICYEVERARSPEGRRRSRRRAAAVSRRPR